MTVSSRLSPWVLGLGLAGCAAPFSEIDPGEKRAGDLVLGYCGCSTSTAADVIRAIDEPPVGPGNVPSNSQPSHLTVCLQLANKGSKPAKIDRSHVRLDTAHERDMWTPDQDDEVFVVPPGETRTFKVPFEISSPMLSGEDLQIHVETAVTVGNQPARLPAIRLRRK